MDFNTIFSSIGTWTLGSFVIIDLIAATTNAFNGAILASRPDHHRKWTVVGIVLIAIAGGIGGGVTRDVLLNDLPSALTNPWYMVLCLLAAVLALTVIKGRTPESVARIFDFMAAFSLPWYAIVGTQKALGENLGLLAVVLIGVIGPTAGRYFIDITSRVTPQHFTRGNWFVGTAALASLLYILFDALFNRLYPGISVWPATLIAWAICFTFRLLSLRYNWQEPEPWDQNAAERGEPSSAPATRLISIPTRVVAGDYVVARSRAAATKQSPAARRRLPACNCMQVQVSPGWHPHRNDKYEFQYWACSLVEAQPYAGRKKGADTGIDGLIFFQDDTGAAKKVLVSVKGGESVGVSMLKDLIATVQREGAQIGLIVTLANPTEPMLREAVSGREGPRYPDMSRGGHTFKKARKEDETGGPVDLVDKK